MRYLKYLVSSVVFLGVIGALLAVKASQIGLIMNYAQAAKQEGPPPETVSSAVAQKVTWQETLSAVGSVEAGKGVTLSTDVAGIVTRVAFESGDAVRLGQALVELDTSVERAQLASARARLELARTTLARTEKLATANVVTTAEFDSAAATAKSTQAEVVALEAQIARKVVTAPFAGKLGIRLVNVGQFVSPGAALCTLQSQRGEFVDFSIAQQHLQELRVALPVTVKEKNSGIELQGKIAAISPDVDPGTRSVTVRASIEDPERRLRPGMFLNVGVELEAHRDVVQVPATAIVHAPYGDSLFLIDGDAKQNTSLRVKQQFVRLGEARGDFVEVTQGLSGGESIVLAGAFKLRNGARVVVDNDAVALVPKLAPEPANR
jgi:membrane fusion protein (multidrug efflux system)